MTVAGDLEILTVGLEKLKLTPKTETKTESLVTILRMEKGSNKFVVSKNQLNETKKLFSDEFKDFDSWYEFFSRKGVKKLPVLFSAFKKNHSAIYDDQLARSKFIVDYVSSHNDMELVTMDGHGRLIYTMLDYAIKNEKSFKTNLVDIDETTNDFHKVMFPNKIFGDNSLSVNIPKTQDILNLDSDFIESIKNPFMYLNFCGISCCSKSKMSGRNRVYQFIKKWLETHESIMISLSLRPHGFVERVDGVMTNYGMIHQFDNVEEVSKRSNFVTYFIKAN